MVELEVSLWDPGLVGTLAVPVERQKMVHQCQVHGHSGRSFPPWLLLYLAGPKALNFKHQSATPHLVMASISENERAFSVVEKKLTDQPYYPSSLVGERRLPNFGDLSGRLERQTKLPGGSTPSQKPPGCRDSLNVFRTDLFVSQTVVQSQGNGGPFKESKEGHFKMVGFRESQEMLPYLAPTQFGTTRLPSMGKRLKDLLTFTGDDSGACLFYHDEQDSAQNSEFLYQDGSERFQSICTWLQVSLLALSATPTPDQPCHHLTGLGKSPCDDNRQEELQLYLAAIFKAGKTRKISVFQTAHYLPPSSCPFTLTFTYGSHYPRLPFIPAARLSAPSHYPHYRAYQDHLLRFSSASDATRTSLALLQQGYLNLGGSDTIYNLPTITTTQGLPVWRRQEVWPGTSVMLSGQITAKPQSNTH
ncbi:hypothetical protein Bbelb_349030 [Branchiostoma belcheri]|nr:hypothetical protein Bbelb_349030 [Branchiostoma belcheri]